MPRYSALVGKRVQVVYRVGNVHLVVAGLLLGDSGQSIFLEQCFDQHGSLKTVHLKIPYHCIVRLNEIPSPSP